MTSTFGLLDFEVAKFNPNHDDKGQFSSGEGGGSSGGKTPSAELKVLRELHDKVIMHPARGTLRQQTSGETVPVSSESQWSNYIGSLNDLHSAIQSRVDSLKVSTPGITNKMETAQTLLYQSEHDNFQAPRNADHALAYMHDAIIILHRELGVKTPSNFGKVDKSDHTGCMLAYMLPQDVASKFAIPGGEPASEMHITIAYFGKDLDEQTIDAIKAAAGVIASTYAPLDGVLGGVGKFPASPSSENKEVSVLLADVPRLETLRESILNKLEVQGISAVRNHGFSPHVTIEYHEPGKAQKVNFEETPISVDSLTVMVGNDRFGYPLNGKEVFKFNPNHDDKGRFTSGEGAGNSSGDRTKAGWKVQSNGYSIKDLGKGISITHVKGSPYIVAEEEGRGHIAHIHAQADGDNLHITWMENIEGNKLGPHLARQAISSIMDFTDTKSVSGLRVSGARHENKETKVVGKREHTFGLLDFGIPNEKPSDATNSFDIAGTISKVDLDKHWVFGWASVISEAGQPIVDSQGDVILPDDLENMAYNFVLSCRKAGEMHTRSTGVGSLIESCVFTREKQKALGIDLGKVAWWIGFFIEDEEVWSKIRSGNYSAFSIHGTGSRNDLPEDITALIE